MKDSKKIGSSGSKDGLIGVIAKFYCSDPANIILKDSGIVFNKKINKEMSTSWSRKGNRYFFWSSWF